LHLKDCKIGLFIRDLTEAKVLGINGAESITKFLKNTGKTGGSYAET